MCYVVMWRFVFYAVKCRIKSVMIKFCHDTCPKPMREREGFHGKHQE